MSFLPEPQSDYASKFRAGRDDALLHRMGCRACPLAHETANLHPFMDATGAKKPVVYMLGEAPGRTEDEQGRQFVGDSGEILRPLVPDDYVRRVRWNNVINCHPPKNRNPDRIEVECCRSRVVGDIEATQPRAVFGFGNFPLEWAIGQQGITLWRGRRLPVRIGQHVCWFFPMLHPSYLLRSRRGNKPSAEERMFELDLERAFASLETLPEPQVHTAADVRAGCEIISEGGTEGLRQVRELLEWAAEQPVVGVDYETSCLRPYQRDARILTVGVGTGERAVAFPLEHPEAPWSDDEFDEVVRLWCNFLRVPRVRRAVHNLAFDLEWTGVMFGEEYVRVGLWEDTATQAAILDERHRKMKAGPFSLDWLVLQYFGFHLKSLFPELNRSKLETYPLETVLNYNAPDAKYHALLYAAQAERIREEGLEEPCELARRRVPTVVLSQMRGVPVDQAAVRELRTKYDVQIENTVVSIASLPIVRKFREERGEDFNPLSNPHVHHLFVDMLRRPECRIVDKKTHKERYSADETVLSKIDHPLSKLLLALRSDWKQRSTYIEPLMIGSPTLYDDGCLHTNFNTFFAETGRLCVSENTMLVTSAGQVRIADLDLRGAHRNARIRTHTGNYRRIEELWFKGYEPMLRLRFDTGAYVECTARHRILTDAGWKHAADFEVGDAAIADPSFSYGRGKRRTVIGVRRGQQDTASFIGEILRRAYAPIRFARNFFGRVHGNIGEGVPPIEDLVAAPLRSGYSVRQGSKLRKCYVGEYEGGSSSPTFTKSHRVEGWFDSGRCFLRMLGPRFGHFRFPLAAEYCIPRPFGPSPYAGASIRAHYARQGGYGIIESWNVGRPAGYEPRRAAQWRDPGSCLYRLFGVHSSSREDESSRVCRSAVASRFLEKITSRIRNGEGASRTGYRARSAMAFWAEAWTQKLAAGRFLHPFLGSSYRGRWGSASAVTGGRPGTREDDYESGGVCASGFDLPIAISSTSLHPPITKLARLVSIESVGVQSVWDITVEGDHSYCAHGLIHHNSSDSPNMQNFPKRDGEAAEVRRPIAAPPGCVILAVDYGQIEARVIAMLSGDARFVKSLWDRYDVHMEWAERIARAYPQRIGGRTGLTDKKTMKDFRTDIKNQWTFPLFFGARLSSAAGYLGIPEDRLVDLYDEFWEEFSGIRDWQDELLDAYEERGYVECATGRRRRGPLSLNKIINTPVQGTAAELVLDSMCRLSETGDPELQPELNIHDDLSFLRVPEGRVDEVAEKVLDHMLGVPFEWSKAVPITAEMSCGKNWMPYDKVSNPDGLKEVGTFSSDTWF